MLYVYQLDLSLKTGCFVWLFWKNMGQQWSHENYYVCCCVIALEINRAGADVWFRGEKSHNRRFNYKLNFNPHPLVPQKPPKKQDGCLIIPLFWQRLLGVWTKLVKHKMTHYLPHSLWDHSQKYKGTFAMSSCQLDKASKKDGNMGESRRKTPSETQRFQRCEKQSKIEDGLCPAGGKSKSWAKLPVSVTMGSGQLCQTSGWEWDCDVSLLLCLHIPLTDSLWDIQMRRECTILLWPF